MPPDETIAPGTTGSPAPGPGARFADDAPGTQVGPYKLVSLLGEGGFGTVWLAERREPFVQRVALKILKAGMDSKAVLARFEQERQALAVMNHPGIARVLDGGLTPQGRPYFAMEFVKGEPITGFCDRVRLGIEERLMLFAQACEAVQHAHLKGIVHRDLKPTNILAFMVEGEGPRLKVIDFGVAKAMIQRMSDRTIFTETGQMIGTPEYMSPEQADPTAGDIDTRSDIYSLGVLLYELLVGATPFDPLDLRKRAYGDIQRILRDQDPPSPSVRLSTITEGDPAAARRIESARRSRSDELVRRLRGELEWIPLKAMRKEPQLRYQTAIELAADVRNYLDGRPLSAAPESAAYRVRKYVRRNRALVTGASAVLAALVLGLGLTCWQWLGAIASEARARSEQAAAEAARSEADAQRELAEAGRDRIRDLFAVITEGRALEAARRSNAVALKLELDGLAEIGRSGSFAERVARTIADESVAPPLVHDGQVTAVAWRPDGKELATCAKGGTIRRWDPVTGKQVGEPILMASPLGTQLAYSPDGTRLACGVHSVGVQVWDASSGRAVGPAPVPPGPNPDLSKVLTGLAFSPDGKFIAGATLAGEIRRWDGTSGRELGPPMVGHRPSLETGMSTVWCLAFGPEGVLYSGGEGGGVCRWDVAAGKQVGDEWPIAGSQRRVCSLAFCHDGRMLRVGSSGPLGESGIRPVDPATGRSQEEPIQVSRGSFRIVAPDQGDFFLTVAEGSNALRRWNLIPSDPWVQSSDAEFRGHDARIVDLAISPDLRTVATASQDGTVRLWNSQSPRDSLGQGAVECIALSPDGATVATGLGRDGVQRWDVPSRARLGLPIASGGTASATALSFSPSGGMLAIGGTDGAVRLWDLDRGEQVAELAGCEPLVTQLAFRGDGKVVAACDSRGSIVLWDVAARSQVVAPLRGHEGAIRRIAFSADGRTLASAGEDRTVRLWDANSGQQLCEPLLGHESHVTGLAFGSDGRTLMSGGADGTVRLWDLAGRRPAAPPMRGQRGAIVDVAACPDGRSYLSASADGSLWLWDGGTARPIGAVREGDRDASEDHRRCSAMVLAGNASRGALLGGREVSFVEAVPARDRIAAERGLQDRVAQVREMARSRAEAVGGDWQQLQAFSRELLADPRMVGEFHRAAELVVGEVLDRVVHSRSEILMAAVVVREAIRAGRWTDAMKFIDQMTPVDLDRSIDASLWNEIAWTGLVDVPAGTPGRDLERLLIFAGRAAERSGRRNGLILDTLARAHWELGDKPKAIEVQREAIAVSAAQLDHASPRTKAAHADLESRLRQYESLPAGAALPKEPPPAP